MSTELQISIGIAKLRVNLSEFVSVIKNLGTAAAGAAVQEEIRAAIKKMIREVRKNYDTVVDALTPLYEMNTKRKFSLRFAKVRAAFKKKYLKSGSLVRTHCRIVEQHLWKLRTRRRWMSKLPFVKRSFKRLEILCDSWLAVDTELIEDMEKFIGSLNGFLNGIARLEKREPGEAHRNLEACLEQIEVDFRDIEAKLGDLEVISKRL